MGFLLLFDGKSIPHCRADFYSKFPRTGSRGRSGKEIFKDIACKKKFRVFMQNSFLHAEKLWTQLKSDKNGRIGRCSVETVEIIIRSVIIKFNTIEKFP